MIVTIIILAIAFYWLGFESKWFTVRLFMGKLPEIKKPDNKDTPYYWQPIKDNMILCTNCRMSKHCHKDKERWTGWNIPAKTIKAFDSILNLVEGCNIGRASLLKDVINAHKINKTPSVKLTQLPLFEYKHNARIGSHAEWTRWNHETNELDIVSKYEKGYSKRVVEEFETVYNDCLVSKEWLKEHENFEYPEPTIEISINGKDLHVNGNYKKGLIGDFVSQYTTRVKAGKKTVTVVNEKGT